MPNKLIAGIISVGAAIATIMSNIEKIEIVTEYEK
jgi:hypothetical protein